MTQGIYKLINNKNNQVYIGQSSNIENRFYSHMNMLQNNKHHAYKLQRFYNKNKQSKKFKIDYEVLEIVKDEKYLNAREQYYIDLFDSYKNGFNSASCGNPAMNEKMERQNKYIDKVNEDKNEYDILLLKYGENIKTIRNNYTNRYQYRVNELIKFFVKNYNLDDYITTIYQCKEDTYMKVEHLHSTYCHYFIYSSKYKNIITYRFMQKIVYQDYKDYPNNPKNNKLTQLEKAKRRYQWFMHKFARLDEDIIKYNINNYSSTTGRYAVEFNVIKEIIDYDHKRFRNHIIYDKEIMRISKELGITYPNGKAELTIRMVGDNY